MASNSKIKDPMLNRDFLARMEEIDPEWKSTLQKETSIKQQTISQWTRGIAKPGKDSLQVIASQYHVTVGYLLGEGRPGGFAAILDYFHKWKSYDGFKGGITFDESHPDPLDEEDTVWSLTIYSRKKYSDVYFIKNYLDQLAWIEQFPGDDDMKEEMIRVIKEKTIKEARPFGEEE